MKRIIIKEIDKLYGKNNKNRVVSEFLIYLTIEGTNVQCFNEIGEEAKNERVNMMLLSNFPSTLERNEISNIIEEITM
jgi:hypothetical protein